MAFIALIAPAVLFGVVGYLIWHLPGLLPALLAVVVAGLIVRTSTKSLIAAIEPRPAKDARLLNIVEGLSGELGRNPLPAYVVRGEGTNALVFWHAGGPALGVTDEAIANLARTELEAVVAHCLVRSDPTVGGLERAELLLGGTFGSCGARATRADDARAAAITRYPPALAKAIGKATPATGRFSYLWFVAEGSPQDSPGTRIEALGEL